MRSAAACGLLAVCSAWPFGCVETRVIGNPKFADIPGALVGGQPPTPDDPPGGLAPAFLAEERVVEDEEGRVTLHSPTVRDLIANILFTLDEDRPDLFADMLLASQTRQEFRDRGLAPEAAFAEVRRREMDARRLFTRLPGGEFTPGVFMRPRGDGYYRLQVRKDEQTPWRGLDVRYEGSGWRLRWFVD